MKKQKSNAQTAGKSLHLDWCSYEAAKYAVMHWHYSKRLPKAKLVKIGVWENNKFIGCLIFSYGATPQLVNPYGLKMIEGCELTRVALDKHEIPVTKILSTAIKLLKKQSPGLKLIVSFADSNENHLGIIYQAGNWIYTGKTSKTRIYTSITGKEYHGRNIGNYEGKDKFGVTIHNKKNMIKSELRPSKYRYLYPLTKEMRKQIEPLKKPYPKKLDALQA